jgi:nitrite reductase/ring-hydroxylating ferredoxin subunit
MLSPASRIREGQLVCFEIGGRRLVVGRTAQGFFALDDTCPHASGSLSEGMLEAGAVVCPIHGYAYDVVTGEGLDDGAAVRVHLCVLEGDVLRIQIEEDAAHPVPGEDAAHPVPGEDAAHPSEEDET